MDQIIEIIQALFKGFKNPWQAIAGSLMALFLYIFVAVKKGEFREKKANAEKDEQKGESNIDLENTNADADRSIRDRLDRKP